MRLGYLFGIFTILGFTIMGSPGVAQQLRVKAVVTQWRPLVLFAQPGDTVTFVGMVGHDTVSIEGMTTMALIRINVLSVRKHV